MLAPDCQLTAVAPDVETAITLARDALPFLRAASQPRSLVVSTSDEDDEYTLTCLLCEVINPSRQGKTALVAMQEHQIEEHDLPVEAFQSAVHISITSEEEERYVWALPPALASLLDLPQASYLLATKRRKKDQAAEHLPSTPEVIGLVFKAHGVPPVVQTIHLVGQDAHAWYGYPSEAFGSGDPLALPKAEWELAHPTDISE
jgi:hypothetical protein